MPTPHILCHMLTSLDGKVTGEFLTLPEVAPATEIYYSPVEAASFEGLPPAYIETAEFDCLHDDGILYAQKLREAGIEVTLNETKETMHGFDIMQKAEITKAALAARIAFMKRVFSNPKRDTD